MADETVVRMAGGVAWTAQTAWKYAVTELCVATDRSEEWRERQASALAGLGFVAMAATLEFLALRATPEETTDE